MGNDDSKKPPSVRGRSGGRPKIDKIDPDPGAASEEKVWASVLGQLNPMGVVERILGSALAYSAESKRLTLEAERVREQSRAMNNLIDKTYELKMEDLRQRRLALERTFDLAEQDRDLTHIERREVLQLVSRVTEKALADGITIDERRLFKEILLEATKLLTAFGESARQNLQTLVKSVPTIEMPRNLLEASDDDD